MNLYVTVRERRAQPEPDTQFLVCGNGGTALTVSFDEEWEAYPTKYARIVYRTGGKTVSLDTPVFGSLCTLPAVRGTDLIELGFYAGAIRTTSPARIPCRPCITDIPAEPAPACVNLFRLLLARIAGKPYDIPTNGKYLAAKNGNYIVTRERDFLLTKE